MLFRSIAIGGRDMENRTLEIARRDTLEKQTMAQVDAVDHIMKLMVEIQANIYSKALKFREESTYKVETWDEFVDAIENKGGFVLAHWDGTPETEEWIKQQTKATIRCILIDNEKEEGFCIKTGKPSSQRVVFAKAY